LAKRYSEEPNAKESGGLLPEINRSEKIWDPTFLAAAFRLKDGEISPVIKSKFGYHIIQMVQRRGDDAIVRHILRVPPVTDAEVNLAINKLDSIRSRIIAGTTNFSAAAGKYTEDETAKYAGPFMISRDGDTYLTIDELDKEVVPMLDKLQVGEFSQPVVFTDDRGKKGVRFLYLKTRTQPHRMNVKDDYNKIAQVALEEKKMATLSKWLEKNIGTYYIMIDQSTATCGQMQKWINAQKATATNKSF
jgi:peptidyl-prolyl cis-trans isomerase SurA